MADGYEKIIKDFKKHMGGVVWEHLLSGLVCWHHGRR